MSTAGLRAAHKSDVASNFVFYDLQPPADDFCAEIIAGLEGAPKSLPCKFFYDAIGSRLFERICELDEYYPTRTEIALLRRHRNDIAALLGRNAHLLEFGSGATTKIRIILDSIGGEAGYTGIDISKEHLFSSAQSLAADFPHVRVTALCADYTHPFVLPHGSVTPSAKKVGFFPGSTIGNFTRSGALDFLAGVARLLGAGGELLIGVDLKKDPLILHAAYNDSEGVTAAFNLNLLARINRELNADFDLTSFSHDAPYNVSEGRIEMYLVSKRDQTVRVSDRSIRFQRDETIHTENSHKFGAKEFQALAARAGFLPIAVWTDDNELFSLHYLRVC
jgi:dimethylhistidine N-methyltransferase